MDSFKIHWIRLFKLNAVISRLNDLQKLPDSFDIPDDIIDSSFVSELVDYVILNYYG